jgi:hypothetical protein
MHKIKNKFKELSVALDAVGGASFGSAACIASDILGRAVSVSMLGVTSLIGYQAYKDPKVDSTMPEILFNDILASIMMGIGIVESMYGKLEEAPYNILWGFGLLSRGASETLRYLSKRNKKPYSSKI